MPKVLTSKKRPIFDTMTAFVCHGAFSRFPDLRMHRDMFAIKVRLLRVHQAVERGVFFPRNTLAGVQHRIKSFA